METVYGSMVEETSARWSEESSRKLLIESCLINFERFLDFLKLQASSAYCYANNEHH